MVDIKQEFERLKNLPDNDIQISQEKIEKYLEKNKTLTLINDYKRKLSETDYKAIKYAEGVMSLEEYAPVKIEREMYRAKINELEKML